MGNRLWNNLLRINSPASLGPTLQSHSTLTSNPCRNTSNLLWQTSSGITSNLLWDSCLQISILQPFFSYGNHSTRQQKARAIVRPLMSPCVIDLTPLRPCRDSDYAFWTRDQSTTEMPRKSRNELVYILFSKVLSQTSALQSLYLWLPPRWPTKAIPDFYDHFQIDDLHMVQLQQIAERFRGFCQGHSLLNLPKLKTLGLLEHDYFEDVQFPMGLCKKLLGLPCLQEVLCANNILSFCAHLHIFDKSSPELGVGTSNTAPLFISSNLPFQTIHGSLQV